MESNMTIIDAQEVCKQVIQTHNNIMVSISGGADSDVVLDLVMKVIKEQKIDLNKIHFVFFDTGIEYQATKEHLDYLEKKYNIIIERHKAVKPVPLGCKIHGLPFLAKQVSEYISRLQKYGFDFANDGKKEYEELLMKYPNCSAALKWWCNKYKKRDNGTPSSFNISYNAYLKEFMILNPPTFKISQKCCKGAKKDNAHNLLKQLNADLNIIGIRKSEHGIRSTSYKSCFSKGKETDDYRPIFWFTDKDKQQYIENQGITHSKCYSHYGLKRTGCAGCPFGKEFEIELQNAKQFEPKLYIAINNIFKDSYEYTRAYLKFREEQKRGKLKRLF